MIHELKCWPEPFSALRIGIKTFEYRRDDRNPPFAPGDQLFLSEWFQDQYTGRSLLMEVQYLIRGPAFDIPEGYCIMSVKQVDKAQDNPDPEAISKLRQRTGCGILSAKQALVATNGHQDLAEEWIQRSGLAVVMPDNIRYPKVYAELETEKAKTARLRLDLDEAGAIRDAARAWRDHGCEGLRDVNGLLDVILRGEKP